MKKAYSCLTAASLLAVSALVLTGCIAENKTTTLFTADSNALKSILTAEKADVNIDDIKHFYVTLTKIELDYSGSGSDTEGEAEGETEGEAPEKQNGNSESKIIVFEGELEVDLLDLLGVSEVISTGEIPPGDYTKLRLSITDPRLVLASDPETEITDIKLTANSRLFVSQKFSIPEGNNLLILDFGGVKLVELGNGGFTLTPQLDVELTVQSADVQSTGTVVSFDGTTLIISMGEDSNLSVTVNSDTQILPDDTDPPASVADLVEGATVNVSGIMYVDGSITATSITIGS